MHPFGCRLSMWMQDFQKRIIEEKKTNRLSKLNGLICSEVPIGGINIDPHIKKKKIGVSVIKSPSGIRYQTCIELTIITYGMLWILAT